ncbi:hypothetical protein, partial [Streptomyces sp. NPDC057910]|uniref:hypothetical protein n=1 Tax=Streptomyces sp. NPDC057910 TaxID=3346278 RepID=UPI0036E9948C
WQLLSQWGAVPRMLVWDNEAGIGQGKVTAEFAAFAGMPCRGDSGGRRVEGLRRGFGAVEPVAGRAGLDDR